MTRATRRGFLAGVTFVALIAVGLGLGAAVEWGTADPTRELTIVWLARVLLFLAAAWVVIGMLAARTSIVGRPGAAAARVSWIAATRPWRARESTLGMLPLDRWLLILIPGALLVATRALQTSFTGWEKWAVVLAAWLGFAAVVRMFIGRRSPWPTIAAVGGVVVFRCLLTLVPLSFAVPGGAWLAFWTNPALRTVYLGFGFALFAWAFIAAAWALSVQLGTHRATGSVLAGVGTGLAIPTAIIAIAGLGAVRTLWNGELGLLPWGITNIFGVMLPQDIVTPTLWGVALVGAVIAVVGVLMAKQRPQRSAAS